MSNQPNIRIFVLNWNGVKDSLECLASLKKINYMHHSITVIDNNSVDDSVNMIGQMFPDLEIIKLSKNYGYAGGNNRGFHNIDKYSEDDYVLFLNNDTIVERDFLTELVEGIREYGPDAILSPKIYFYHDPELIWFSGGRVKLHTGYIAHPGIRNKDNPANSINQKTDFVSGCSLLIRANLFKQLGGFDENFGMYSEDVDLCLRAAKQGAECHMIANSHIYHKVSASYGSNFSISKNIIKLTSLLKLVRKHKGNTGLIIAIIYNCCHIPIQLIRLLRKKYTRENYA